MGLTFSKVHPGAGSPRAPMQLNALYKCHHCTTPLLGRPWVLLHPCGDSRFHLSCFYTHVMQNAPAQQCGMCATKIEAVYIAAPGYGVDGKWFRIVDKDYNGPVQLPLIPVGDWETRKHGKGKERKEGEEVGGEGALEALMKECRAAVEKVEKNSVGLLTVRGG